MSQTKLRRLVRAGNQGQTAEEEKADVTSIQGIYDDREERKRGTQKLRELLSRDSVVFLRDGISRAVTWSWMREDTRRTYLFLAVAQSSPFAADELDGFFGLDALEVARCETLLDEPAVARCLGLLDSVVLYVYIPVGAFAHAPTPQRGTRKVGSADLFRCV